MELERAKWILNQFPINDWIYDSENILDIGCGMGYIDNRLNSIVEGKVFGFDIFDYRTKYLKLHTNFNYLFADCYRIPFKDNVFDAVMILVSLHHMWFPQNALEEALRVLKKSGKLVILEDLISNPFSIQTKYTYFVDRIINLSLKNNPNTHKTKSNWLSLFTNKYNLELLKEFSIKWGGVFKFLELGVFLLRK